MLNKIYSNGLMPYSNAGSALLKAGSVVIFDASGTPFVGVLVGDVDAGAAGLADLTGVYALPKGTSEAISAGAALYITSAGMVTGTATGNSYLGRAHEAAAAALPTVLVRINFGSKPQVQSGG